MKITVEDNGNICSVELVPVGDKFQPNVNVNLNNGFKTTTSLPPQDYTKLREKLSKLAKTTDIAALESYIKKIIFFLSL